MSNDNNDKQLDDIIQYDVNINDENIDVYADGGHYDLNISVSEVSSSGFRVNGSIRLGTSSWNALGFDVYTSVNGVGTKWHTVTVPNYGGSASWSDYYSVGNSGDNRTYTCNVGADMSWSSTRPSTSNPRSTTVTVQGIRHTVSYNANGGSGAPSSQTKKWGSILTLSSTKPKRTGYTFQGWGTSASDTTPDYQPGDQYGADKDITLYAIWTINQYTVTFKDSLNSSWSHAVKVNYGGNATPPSPPSHTGYTFAGWNGSYTEVDSNRTVTATYTINKYYIDVNGSLDGSDTSGTSPMGTFDMYINGGLTSNDTTDYYQQHNYQTSYEIKDIRANTGYNYTGATGSLSGKVPANSVAVRLNFTTKVYTVSFNANLGETVSGMPSSVKKTHFKSITLPTNVPTARRYEFLGWSTSPTGSAQYKPGATYSTEGNATLYAIWKLRASIISWYDANGNRKDGLCSIYDSSGAHHYAILYLYDSNGNRHEVI